MGVVTCCIVYGGTTVHAVLVLVVVIVFVWAVGPDVPVAAEAGMAAVVDLPQIRTVAMYAAVVVHVGMTWSVITDGVLVAVVVVFAT